MNLQGGKKGAYSKIWQIKQMIASEVNTTDGS